MPITFMARLTSWCRAVLAAALAVGVLAATLAHGQARPEFSGVWTTTMSHPDEAEWAVADFACMMGCSEATHRRLSDLLADHANDERRYEELVRDAWETGGRALAAMMTPEGLAFRDALGYGDEAAIACEPIGLFRLILSPVPFEIAQQADRIVLRYEEWNVVRTVYMDGRRPETLEPTLYGYSIGRYEGDALTVETVGATANLYRPQLGGGGYSDQARFIERYTHRPDSRVMDLELTIVDPVMLKQPLVYRKPWLSMPGIELLEHSCDAISGKP